MLLPHTNDTRGKLNKNCASTSISWCLIFVELAAEIMSEEHKRLGHRPKSGSFAATVQSIAYKNQQRGTKLTIADILSM